MSETEQQFGRFDGVVVSKETLLSTLEENKKKHDALYELACEAYKTSVFEYAKGCGIAYKAIGAEYEKYSEVPMAAFDTWDKKSPFYFDAIRIETKSPNSPKCPSSHEDDYINAIRRIQMSVYDTFSLSETEFQQYILNNWSWKRDFIQGFSVIAGSGARIGTGVYSGMTYQEATSKF